MLPYGSKKIRTGYIAWIRHPVLFPKVGCIHLPGPGGGTSSEDTDAGEGARVVGVGAEFQFNSPPQHLAATGFSKLSQLLSTAFATLHRKRKYTKSELACLFSCCHQGETILKQPRIHNVNEKNITTTDRTECTNLLLFTVAHHALTYSSRH